MSFLDGLSSALTVGTQAAGAYQNAQRDAEQRKSDNFLTSIKLLAQQHDREVGDQLNKAQIGLANARIHEIENPVIKPPTPRTPHFVTEEDGTVKAVDTETLEVRPVAGVRARKPSDPFATMAESFRLQTERQKAADWQRIYTQALQPGRDDATGMATPSLSPADAAAKADEAMGGHPELAPKINRPPRVIQSPMGTSYRPSRP